MKPDKASGGEKHQCYNNRHDCEIYHRKKTLRGELLLNSLCQFGLLNFTLVLPLILIRSRRKGNVMASLGLARFEAITSASVAPLQSILYIAGAAIALPNQCPVVSSSASSTRSSQPFWRSAFETRWIAESHSFATFSASSSDLHCRYVEGPDRIQLNELDTWAHSLPNRDR